MSEVCNFADDNMQYSVGRNTENTILELKRDLAGMMERFKINLLKANSGKFQFTILGNEDERSFGIHVNKVKIKNSNDVALLEKKMIKILLLKKYCRRTELCRRASYKKHISELCRKASYKLHTLRRIRKYLTVEKAKLLANAFISSQFNYASLVWMFVNKLQ